MQNAEYRNKYKYRRLFSFCILHSAFRIEKSSLNDERVSGAIL